MKPIYLKSTGILSGTFVKLTSEGMIETFKGQTMTKMFDDMEDYQCNLKSYIKGDFVIASQQEFDEALIKEVAIINNLSAL
jgi:hypothetical protein